MASYYQPYVICLLYYSSSSLYNALKYSLSLLYLLYPYVLALELFVHNTPFILLYKKQHLITYVICYEPDKYVFFIP